MTIKCVIVGDGSVGKTCMLTAYTTHNFPVKYAPTVFDNYAVTVVVGDEVYIIELFDTAGQADYDGLRPLSYRKTDVFIVCFSVANRASFDNVREKWVPEIRQANYDAPCVLVGTQVDRRSAEEPKSRPDTFVSAEEGRQLAKFVGAIKYIECSALTQVGLKAVFDEAISAALDPLCYSKNKKQCNLI